MNSKKISRRNMFGMIKVGAAAAAVLALEGRDKLFVPAAAYKVGPEGNTEMDAGVQVKYSSCLMCHSGCAIRVRLKDGRIIKIDGNPYDPRTKEPHLPYATDPSEAVKVSGTACVKGQAGLKELYDPLRVKYPLKRAGPRGSGKWKRISWDQAIDEIINGGDLFGEGHVDGLAAIRDLDTPIDPNAPELGPKANQLVYSVGRSEHGRKEFTDRWFKSSFGTTNKRLDHTSICETSHHVGYELLLQKGGLGGKPKNHLKPDIENAEYIIWFGSSPIEANFPMQALARKLVHMRARGGKLVIADPRYSKSAAKANQWIPIKMGTDAAFALGMMRWIFENWRFDTKYLENPSKDAASADGFTNWSDATWLVRLDTMKYLRADAAGLPEGTDEQLVVLSGGAPAIADKADAGDLFTPDGNAVTVNGIQTKTVFQLLKERVLEKTIQEYADICGLDANIITTAADEFTSHGRKACADFYRGTVQHTNGTYNAMAIAELNWLIGNVGFKGGMASGGSHWHETGGKKGNPYNLGKELHPGKVKASGMPLNRAKKKYQDTTEFKNNGYPAKRPWFPLALHGNWQEIVPSIKDGYPYPVKCLINHMGNTVYSTPAGSVYIEMLKDSKKLPLHIAFTTIMGETDVLCDYILPDRHYLERYSTTHTAPAILTTVSQTRVPMVDPVYPETRLEEDVLIEIAKKMGLPGHGDDGFGPGMPLNSAIDWYAKCFANIAGEGDGVPGSTEQEKVDYILARGGRFEDHSKRYKGDLQSHPWKGVCLFYSETLATTIDSMTGKAYDGLPMYEDIKDCMWKPIDNSGFPLVVNTYKKSYHTQSRTAQNEWLMELEPENSIEINSVDAAARGIKTGDRVRVTSASSKEGVEGKALVIEGVRPGVVNICHSYGHWEYGAKANDVDGTKTEAQTWRGAGVSANPIMRLDPVLKDIGLQDPIGGSSSFYDTAVEVKKVR